MIKKLLLIGGPNDGSYVDITDGIYHLQIPIPKTLASYGPNNNLLQQQKIDTAEYKRTTLHTPKKAYEFFLYKFTSLEEAQRKLMSNES